MNIVFLATEFAPLAKVGGLGDVVFGLARELGRQRQKVEVILPKYSSIDLEKVSGLQLEVADFPCLGYPNAMWSGRCEGCSLHLLEAGHPAEYFQRSQIYGCKDDTARFLYFSRAALEYLQGKKEPIDVLHLHDWHVAIAAVLARDLFHLPIRKIALTIHNAEYQGHCATWDLDAIGLDGLSYLAKDKLQDNRPECPKTINLLKGGILYADVVNTVSPTYAKEITKKPLGCHLEKTLRTHQDKLYGILNGIDRDAWDPAKDLFLPKTYHAKEPLEAILQAKEEARKALAARFPVSLTHRPWIGSITRLVPQKGPELLEEGLSQTIQQEGTFLLIGSSPIPALQAHFEALKHAHRKDQRVLFHFAFDEPLAHLTYAALDFLLVPSHFEPCGLTQLIAMRYGTIPIVRSTGGLKDTVTNQNGFVFHRISSSAVRTSIKEAIRCFRRHPAHLHAMLQQNMERDLGWERPAQNYLKIYDSSALRM